VEEDGNCVIHGRSSNWPMANSRNDKLAWNNMSYQLIFGTPTFISSVQACKTRWARLLHGLKRKQRELIVLVWLQATNNGIQGDDQKSKVYHNKIHAIFKALSPAVVPAGCCGDRAPKAIYMFLRD
jgi:hypothetical protein